MSSSPSSIAAEAEETERVDVTIHVGDAVVDLSLTGVEIDCAQDIASAVVSALLNVGQRDRRVLERARLR